jgi:hypothetical protein
MRRGIHLGTFHYGHCGQAEKLDTETSDDKEVPALRPGSAVRI